MQGRSKATQKSTIKCRYTKNQHSYITSTQSLTPHVPPHNHTPQPRRPRLSAIPKLHLPPANTLILRAAVHNPRTLRPLVAINIIHGHTRAAAVPAAPTAVRRKQVGRGAGIAPPQIVQPCRRAGGRREIHAPAGEVEGRGGAARKRRERDGEAEGLATDDEVRVGQRRDVDGVVGCGWEWLVEFVHPERQPKVLGCLRDCVGDKGEERG
ncbi:hypothetical protein EDC01DRAFT_645418 [Geopyxis carbonaria]|nr:hypothetical protein EDC01DRAFT_645418 [Geopyxis carbonaria]